MPWHALGFTGGCKGGLLVKSISARAVLIALFLCLAAVGQTKAEDYYIYQTPNGALVISNKEPPPGTKIIRQLPGVTDREVPQAQEPSKSQPNGQTEGSSKPSNNK